jgi:transcriptional regulator with XRE-family HTH domain
MGPIAENLRRLRKAAGLSQLTLAEKAGVSQQLVSQLENGKNYSTTELPGLAHALGVPVHAIDPAYMSDASGLPTTSVPVVTWVSAGDLLQPDVAVERLSTLYFTDLAPGDWVALRVQGESMNRISPDGSIIIVNRRDKTLVPNKCYVIDDGEGRATFKRYRSNPDRFEPVSTDDFPTIFPDNTPKIIGRVHRSIIDL